MEKKIKRIIPCLFYKSGFLIRSRNFILHQNIGNFINQAERFFEWDVDEMICVNIGNQLANDSLELISMKKIIKKISKNCFLPLTVGGKIKNLNQAINLIRSGADKFLINTKIFENNELITEISNMLGSQAVVASIDYKIVDKKEILFIKNGSQNTKTNIYSWIKNCEDLGVGEFFLNSIDRDGSGKGYDIRTINKVKKITKLPVIACGGASKNEDFLELFRETDIDAAAAGNFFHFKENSYPNLKKFLKNNKINIKK